MGEKIIGISAEKLRLCSADECLRKSIDTKAKTENKNISYKS